MLSLYIYIYDYYIYNILSLSLSLCDLGLQLSGPSLDVGSALRATNEKRRNSGGTGRVAHSRHRVAELGGPK